MTATKSHQTFLRYMCPRTFHSIDEKTLAHAFYGPEMVLESLASLYVWVAHFWIQSRFPQMSHNLVSEVSELKAGGVWHVPVARCPVGAEQKTCHNFHWNNYRRHGSSNSCSKRILKWCLPYPNNARLGDLHKGNIFSNNPGVWKFNIKVPPGLVSSEAMWGPAADFSKANRQVRLMERSLLYFGMLATCRVAKGGQMPSRRLTPCTDSQWSRAFIDRGRGLCADIVQSALIVSLKLVMWCPNQTYLV